MVNVPILTRDNFERLLMGLENKKGRMVADIFRLSFKFIHQGGKREIEETEQALEKYDASTMGGVFSFMEDNFAGERKIWKKQSDTFKRIAIDMEARCKEEERNKIRAEAYIEAKKAGILPEKMEVREYTFFGKMKDLEGFEHDVMTTGIASHTFKMIEKWDLVTGCIVGNFDCEGLRRNLFKRKIIKQIRGRCFVYYEHERRSLMDCFLEVMDVEEFPEDIGLNVNLSDEFKVVLFSGCKGEDKFEPSQALMPYVPPTVD